MRFLQTLLYSLICDAHNWMLNKLLRVCRIYVLLAQNGKGFTILYLVWQQLQLKLDIRVVFHLTDHPPYLLSLAKIT